MSSVSRGRRLLWRLARSLPERVRLRVLPRSVPFRRDELPTPITPPDARIRLLVAPANYAAQGHAWARAAERLPGVGARNLEIMRSSAFGFPRDFAVAEHVATLSRAWGREQLRALRRYTHVLIEAERPILGGLADGDLAREYALLRRSGLRVAYVSHGSDLRLPSRHAALDPWSPFRDHDWDLVPDLETTAAANAAALRKIGAPLFVSTPELLLDVPEATWLPIVVDPEFWRASRPAFDSGGLPVVLHIPTDERIKGSAVVDEVCARLHDEGRIDYRRLTGMPKSEMPRAMASADIVLEQFRLGSYGVSACEAMAAERLTVGHVSTFVRDHVERITGRALPIVQADPMTLEAVLRRIVADPAPFRETASAGAEFVAHAHEGRMTSEVLATFLLAS